jgi:hypothetical protein
MMLFDPRVGLSIKEGNNVAGIRQADKQACVLIK